MVSDGKTQRRFEVEERKKIRQRTLTSDGRVLAVILEVLVDD